MRNLLAFLIFIFSFSLTAEDSAKDWFSKGSLALSTSKKIEAFQKVLQLEPEFWGARCYLGYAWASQQDWIKAAAAFDKELELHPNDFCALYGKGLLFLEQQKWSEAILNLDAVIQLRPDYREAYTARAVAKAALGDSAGAEADRLWAKKGPQISKRQLVGSWGPLLVLGILSVLFGYRVFTRRPWIWSGAHSVWFMIGFFLITLAPMWEEMPSISRKPSMEDLGVFSFVVLILAVIFLILRRIKASVWIYNADAPMVYEALVRGLKTIQIEAGVSPFTIETGEGLIRVSDRSLGAPVVCLRFVQASADFRRRVVELLGKEMASTKVAASPTSALSALAIGFILILISLNEIIFH